jgi:hypothetical protein
MLVLPFAISAMVAIADCDLAHAVPVKPQPHIYGTLGGIPGCAVLGKTSPARESW